MQANYTIAQEVIKSIDRIGRNSHPADLTLEEWQKTLNIIRIAMTQIILNFDEGTPIDDKLVEDGCYLLGAYFMHLFD